MNLTVAALWKTTLTSDSSNLMVKINKDHNDDDCGDKHKTNMMVMMIVGMITYLRIDAHVDNAVEYTTRASADTKKALEYQQKARR